MHVDLPPHLARIRAQIVQLLTPPVNAEARQILEGIGLASLIPVKEPVHTVCKGPVEVTSKDKVFAAKLALDLHATAKARK